jgi:hydroxyacylglutathione hydrolase
MHNFEVTAIPAFTDNYIWAITQGEKYCAIVDPGEAQPVRDFLSHRGLSLEYILITHHHPDQTGGVAQLKAETGAGVFGPHDPRIPGQTRSFFEGETVGMPRLALQLRVIEIPGHTSTHIAFYGDDMLFCGDTLFSVGCGRLFEGTPEQMQTSLDKLASLPVETRVYCGHEYTLSNCQFALAVEPENKDLIKRAEAVRQARSAGKPTVPSTIGEELLVNPFLRTRQDSVNAAARKRKAGVYAGAPTLAVIRAWKDAF